MDLLSEHLQKDITFLASCLRTQRSFGVQASLQQQYQDALIMFNKNASNPWGTNKFDLDIPDRVRYWIQGSYDIYEDRFRTLSLVEEEHAMFCLPVFLALALIARNPGISDAIESTFNDDPSRFKAFASLIYQQFPDEMLPLSNDQYALVLSYLQLGYQQLTGYEQ